MDRLKRENKLLDLQIHKKDQQIFELEKRLKTQHKISLFWFDLCKRTLCDRISTSLTGLVEHLDSSNTQNPFKFDLLDEMNANSTGKLAKSVESSFVQVESDRFEFFKQLGDPSPSKRIYFSNLREVTLSINHRAVRLRYDSLSDSQGLGESVIFWFRSNRVFMQWFTLLPAILDRKISRSVNIMGEETRIGTQTPTRLKVKRVKLNLDILHELRYNTDYIISSEGDSFEDVHKVLFEAQKGLNDALYSK